MGIVLILISARFVLVHGVRAAQAPALDLPSFYFGAQQAFVARQSPYDLAAMARQSSLMGQRIFPYLYPPSSLLILYPLAWVSYPAAHAMMLMLNFAALALIGRLLFGGILGWKTADVFRQPVAALSVIYLLSLRGVGQTIDFGQVNLIVLAMLCLSWQGMKAGSSAWAIAIPLAGATLLKTYPALFILLLLLRRQYKPALLTIGLLAGAVLWSTFVLPAGLWSQWTTDVAPTGRWCTIPHGLGSPAVEANQGLNGFFSRLCIGVGGQAALWPHPRGAALFGSLAALALLAVTCLACLHRSSPGQADSDSGRVDRQFSAFLCISFLIAPLAWEHHLTYIAAAMIVMFTWASKRSGLIVLLLSIALVTACPPSLADLPWPPAVLCFAASAVMFAVLGLWTTIIYSLLASGKPLAAIDCRESWGNRWTKVNRSLADSLVKC